MQFYKLPNGRHLEMVDDMPAEAVAQLPYLIEVGLIDISDNATISEAEYQAIMNPKEMTWINILQNHRGFDGEIESISEMSQIAKTLAYQYFCWNGHIYLVATRRGNVTYFDTGYIDFDVE